MLMKKTKKSRNKIKIFSVLIKKWHRNLCKKKKYLHEKHKDFQFPIIIESKASKCETFFIFCFAALRPTVGHYQRDSLTYPILITAFSQFSASKVTRSLVMRLGI